MDSFNKRKKDILSKRDKSSKGNWDKKISKLCEKVNLLDNYYTTSSCSGRIVIIKDEDKRRHNLFLAVFHDIIGFDKFVKYLPKEKAKLNLKFKQEPPILHVACRDIKSSFELLEKARKIGWKRSGVISEGKRFVVELVSTEKLEFPLIEKGKLLVNNNFLRIVLEKANKNLKKGFDKIKRLGKEIGKIEEE